MGPATDRRPSKSKFVRSLSLRNLRKSDPSSSSSEGSCVVVVGSTGTGKSSTISRYTGCEVRTGSGTESVTEQCTLWPGRDLSKHRQRSLSLMTVYIITVKSSHLSLSLFDEVYRRGRTSLGGHQRLGGQSGGQHEYFPGTWPGLSWPLLSSLLDCLGNFEVFKQERIIENIRCDLVRQS